MKRNIDINEISDGRLYSANDMVKADCKGCINCSACCQGMGNSIILDPLDIHNLCSNLNVTFDELADDKIQLNVVDGIILPNLIMDDKCGFLDNDGRCSIHSFRPGICRLFPLGRIYDDKGFKYFNQIYECPVKNKGKVKVDKWINIGNIKEYEKYIWQWHCFIKECQMALAQLDEQQIRTLQLLILRTFYTTPYEGDFYETFYERLNNIKQMLGL